MPVPPEVQELRDLLPPEHAPPPGTQDVLAWLREQFGEPEITHPDASTERLKFALPGMDLFVHRKVASGALFGFVLAQAGPPPPPCPTPGPTGASLAAVGTGTAAYGFLGGGNAAFTTAFAAASAAVRANYRALKGTLCAAVCPPPCRCIATPSAPPAVAVTTATVWGGPFGWIPVGRTMTVTITFSADVACA